MTIVEQGYEGRDYPVLVNADGLAVAAPFPCGRTGLFGSRSVIQVRDWQRAMGNCGHDPMGGGEFDQIHLDLAHGWLATSRSAWLSHARDPEVLLCDGRR